MFLSLGETPLTDAYVDPESQGGLEPRYPLTVAFCSDCSLVQILETVAPEEMFEDYQYFSSFSDMLLEHSRDNALRLIAERSLGPDSLVVELASNDGYLLRNFVEHGIPVLGIDPAKGPAEAAEARGIPTIRAFFGPELASRLRREGKTADVIIANNVLAHVPDLNGFVSAVGHLLHEEGLAVIEVPYVRDLIEKREFDTIYHEHLCYYSVTALDGLFDRNGICLNEVERYPIHGGSLRLYVSHSRPRGDSVRRYLGAERASGLNEFGYYEAFAARVQSLLYSLRRLISDLKGSGKRIAAYGAAAKGTVLLNYAGIGNDLIEFVVDRNVHKQGLLMPGVRVPIRDPSDLLTEFPDYVLLLAWNFKEEILRQQSEYSRLGGKFIVPIPFPEII